ncbi:MAG TPA: hypothetical protein PLQ93_06845 [Bacteroidia bacterium]|nr:hypothetical protein [Bacteroidia bacterium]
MKKFVYILASAAMLCGARPVLAQDQEGIFNLYYSMGLATGDLHDYISRYSWRGMGMEYKSEITDNVSMGIGAEWNTFYQDMNQGTFTRDNVAITGDQFRYMNSFPMSARINYYKDNAAGLRYFAGAGIGTTYMIKALDMSIYRFTQDEWQFLIAPEAGVSYDIDASRTIFLSVKYNLNLKTKDLAGQSYLAINVGFGFR